MEPEKQDKLLYITLTLGDDNHVVSQLVHKFDVEVGKTISFERLLKFFHDRAGQLSREVGEFKREGPGNGHPARS